MYWYLQALKKYAVFSGRARRAEYWQFTIVNAVIFFGLSLLAKLDAGIGVQMLVLWLATTYSLWMILPSWAVLVRRLHDTNHSGWWLLIGLVPIVGAIALFIWMVTDSNAGDNQYGPNPKASVYSAYIEEVRRRSRWWLPLGLAAVLGAVAVGGIFYAANRGTEEVRILAPWPGIDAVAAEVATVDLTPLGLQKTGTARCTRDVRIRCAVRRRCGDRVWGGWKPSGGRDSAAIFEQCGRGQSLQQPSGVGAGKLPDEHLRQLGQLRSHPLQVRQRPRPDPVER